MDQFEVALGASAPKIQSIAIAATVISPDTVEVAYTGLPGRDPTLAGDYVGIWQGTAPWGVQPLATHPITTPVPDGTVALTGLRLASLPYAVAYSAGSDPEGHDIAAVQTVSPGGLVGTLQNVNLALSFVGPTSLVVSYSVPLGETPKTFGHQLVLQQGAAYNPDVPPVASTTTTDASSDTAAFNGLAIIRGMSYTVAYLAGPKPANAAATLTFQVA